MKYQTTWNLGLLYKNEKDPQIEKDVVAIEKACAVFEKKYKGKDFISNSKKLLAALKDYEKLQQDIIPKPWWYFTLKKDIDTENAFASAAATRIDQRINQAANNITFFSLAIAKIPKKQQAVFLKDTALSRYNYLLKIIFDNAQYNLSEKEEQLALLLQQTSYTMWVDRHQQLVNKQTVVLHGKKIPISEAQNRIANLPKNERRELQLQINAVLKNISTSSEGELNAIFNYKKTIDDRRGFSAPYSSTLLGNENTEKEVLDLVKVVTEYFSLSKRFYKLHAKLLGEKKLLWPDRGASIGKIDMKFDFDEAVKIVDTAFQKIDPKYSVILHKFLKKGQIDVLPRKGKRGGGYCWGVGDLPTYILLNHVGTIESVETLAHEMGHAIHGELDDHLPSVYQGHSTATAEVASTFFEQVVVEDLMGIVSEEERIILLHGRINRDIYCIQAQVAGFNYELELHNTLKVSGELTKEQMAELMVKHMKSYLGDAFDVSADDGYRYVNWVHIRMFFYLYSYAYGGLISRAMFEKWKQDKSFAKKVEQFLSAGRSMSPKDIFKSIGITTDAKFFEAGLKGIEADVDKLEKMSKNWLKKRKSAKV